MMGLGFRMSSEYLQMIHKVLWVVCCLFSCPDAGVARLHIAPADSDHQTLPSYPALTPCSYHYEYALGAGALLASPDTALWLYDLWVCAAAAGCLAYNVKLVSLLPQ